MLVGRYPFLLPNMFGACCAFGMLPPVIFGLPETRNLNQMRAASEEHSNTCSEAAIELSPGEKSLSQPNNCVVIRKQESAYTRLEGGTEGTETPKEHDGGVANALDHACSRVAPPRRDNDGGDAWAANPELMPELWGPDGLVSMPKVKIILFLGCIVQAFFIGFKEVFPLWMLSTRDAGGLGWNTFEIGQVLFVMGGVISIFQFVVSPPLVKIIGVARYQRIGGTVGVPAFIAVSCVKSLTWNNTSLHVVLVMCGALSYSCMHAVNLALVIASTDIPPRHLRGAFSGLYNTAESLGRSVGPAGLAMTFAWSISPAAPSWVDHHFVFILCATASSIVAVVGWRTFNAESLNVAAVTAHAERGALGSE